MAVGARADAADITMHVDRSAVSVAAVGDPGDEKAYWLTRSPQERLAAVELYRRIAFGYDPLTARLQRVLEVAEFPPR